MKIKKRLLINSSGLLFIILCTIFLLTPPGFSYPVKFADSMGKNIVIDTRPERVVSLVPSVTEIIFKIGAGDAVRAVTYHDNYPGKVGSKSIVGGFFSPSIELIDTVGPDIIFLSRLQKEVAEKFRHGKCKLIELETESIADSYKNILLLGKIFNKEKQAAMLVDEIKTQLRIVSEKINRIPDSKRKRVLRFMGRDSVMTPGDDSYQNEMIRAAGGITPVLGKTGNIVVITKEEWATFNPQVIYGCGGDRETANTFFNRQGWKDVDAVKNGKIFYFPCSITCRAATHTGHFVSWLASRIYTEAFSIKADRILEEKIFKSRNIDLNLDYINNTQILYSHINDFLNKTLVINFNQPLSVVSTIEGKRSDIEFVGNHYYPPPCWAIGYKSGLKSVREKVYQVIGKSEKNASFLFTGADMDNLAITRERFKEMEVCALVTAGVKSNAVRMSRDEGKFYEPGTINIILLPNMKLTSRAMTRAIISATEAKTAALTDLDVRSSYSSALHRATGTGTDNIIVVQGTGIEIANAGGHSKLGELIAKAVYGGVHEAIYKQNKITAARNIFQRLQERKISIYGLVSGMTCKCISKKSDIVVAVEKLLIDDRYAGFIESALALSDDYEKGLLKDLNFYNEWCKEIAENIAEKQIDKLDDLVQSNDIPVVLKAALNAILNGVIQVSKGQTL
ncbi:MAG: adenosylcobinamide amidohydrolase [Desulfobacteraceae bacterium]|nr:adenosylcobinamide amidohydrolase [Desulfobacteraceae bacterium]